MMDMPTVDAIGHWSPCIITVAPNGARKTHADHRALPMNDQEIAQTASLCRDAGAAMIHLHVRDSEGNHTLEPDIYNSAIEAIRHAVGDDLVIQMTTEAVGKYAPTEQMAAVKAVRPEAVSLAIRELVPDEASEPAAADFFVWLAEEGTMPQYILYSDEDVRRFEDLIGRGVIPERGLFVLFVLGRYAKDQRSAPADLVPFLCARSGDYPWAVCAFGPLEGACALTAAALGGHSRIGFENNMYMADGSLAPDNAALVAQSRIEVEKIGRPLADANHVREVFSNAAS